MSKPPPKEDRGDPDKLWVTYCKCGHEKTSHKEAGCEACLCKKFKYNGEL